MWKAVSLLILVSHSDMAETSPQSITQLMIVWSNGDQAALDRLIPDVYQVLRRNYRASSIIAWMNREGWSLVGW